MKMRLLMLSFICISLLSSCQKDLDTNIDAKMNTNLDLEPKLNPKECNSANAPIMIYRDSIVMNGKKIQSRFIPDEPIVFEGYEKITRHGSSQNMQFSSAILTPLGLPSNTSYFGDLWMVTYSIILNDYLKYVDVPSLQCGLINIWTDGAVPGHYTDLQNLGNGQTLVKMSTYIFETQHYTKPGGGVVTLKSWIPRSKEELVWHVGIE